jgi:hypothetical protein
VQFSNKTSLPDAYTITLCLDTSVLKLHGRPGLPLYVETLQIGAIVIIDEARIRYPEWDLQDSDDATITNCIDHLLATYVVRKHRFSEDPPALRLQSAIIIARGNLVQAIEESLPFDPVSNQILILSVLVSTGARAGDIGWVSQDSPDRALQLKETELHLLSGSGESSLNNVVSEMGTTQYKGDRTRDCQTHRHSISTYEQPGNAALDTVGLSIASFMRRGLLQDRGDTLEEILARADADPLRRICLRTEDLHKPFLLPLTKNASYNDELRAASSGNISLGHSGQNKAVGLAARYADGSTENASRVRESVLPVLQPGEDGTKLTRDNADPLQMSETLHDAKPRGWMSFHDRRGCADIDIVRSL